MPGLILTPAAGVRRLPPARSARSPLRLTPRGRAVVRALAATAVGLAATLLLTLVVGLAVLLGGGQAQGGSQTVPVPVTYHVVAPGETLWELALSVRPGQDPRDTVARIIELNQLRSANVPVGTRLVLPVG
jgi:hypothetical protein